MYIILEFLENPMNPDKREQCFHNIKFNGYISFSESLMTLIAIIGGHNRCVDYLATLMYPYHKDINDKTPLDYVIDNDESTITDIPTANAIAKFLCESNREIYYGDAMKD